MLPIAVYQPLQRVLIHGNREHAPSHIVFQFTHEFYVSKVFAARNFHILSKTIRRLYLAAKALSPVPLKAGPWRSFSN